MPNAVKPSQQPPEPPAIVPFKQYSFAQRTTNLLTATSLFFIVMTPISYAIGRAYHDGWYRQLGVDGSLFPLDTASMLQQGFLVAANGLAKLAVAILKRMASHWLALLTMIFVSTVTLTICRWMGHWIDAKVTARPKMPPHHQRLRQRKPTYLFITSLLSVALILLALYETVIGLPLAAGLFTQPFYQLGKEDAAQHAMEGFIHSPEVNIKTSNGEVRLREIACGSNFCAVWGSGHASQAPISVIEWANPASQTASPAKNQISPHAG